MRVLRTLLDAFCVGSRRDISPPVIVNTGPGPWQVCYRCVECLSVLSRDTRMHSRGVCPHCGHVATATICASEKGACRREEDGTFTYRWPSDEKGDA